MRVLSLFSGIGGLDLAVEHAFGAKTVAQVEIDPHCQEVLRHHWPMALRDADIRTFYPRPGRADIVCGGFPCTDLSNAGKRKGITPDTRSGLWFEMLRVVKTVQPKYVVIENVPQLLKEEAWAQVRDPLLAAGYGIRFVRLSAEDVGAPHLRKRVFVLATKGTTGCQEVLWLANARQKQLWPTPVHGDKDSRGTGYQQGGQPLTVEVRRWASPAHRDSRSGKGRQEDNGHSPQLPEQVGGVLNPEWVELLMGYCLGWTGPKCGPALDWPAPRGAEQFSFEPTRTLPPRWKDGSKVSRRARIGMLGNAVVPLQARKALQMLLGD